MPAHKQRNQMAHLSGTSLIQKGGKVDDQRRQKRRHTDLVVLLGHLRQPTSLSEQQVCVKGVVSARLPSGGLEKGGAVTWRGYGWQARICSVLCNGWHLTWEKSSSTALGSDLMPM